MKPIAVVFLLAIAGCTVGEDQILDPGGEDPADSMVIAAGPALIWPRLALDDSNQDVTTVQYLLAQAGHAVVLDGRFGPTTKAAVASLQASRGLIADGIVGEQTWLALLVEVNAGDAGRAVEAVQYLLKNRYNASLDITGVYGATTRARLESFQTEKCLGSTGIVGRYTWNSLVSRRSYCNNGGVGSTAAQRVLAAHNAGTLTLWDQTFGRFDGADPLSNITAAAEGRRAKTSCYGTAPCTTVSLSNGLLNGMAALRATYGYRYFVTAISGASHSAGSYHYAGRAFDLDTINGVRVNGDSALVRDFMAACRALGAIEVLGPPNAADHSDHVHCAW